MAIGPRTRPALWLGGLAGGGVLLTHLVAYYLVSSGSSAPDLHASTGHRYWPFVAAVLFGLFVAGLVRFAVGQLTGQGEGERRRFWFVAGRMVVIQSLGFLALEAAERHLAGGVEHLFDEPVVLVGLVVQILVALAAAVLLVVFARVVDLIASFLRHRYRAPKALVVGGARREAAPPLALAAGGATLRGPPFLPAHRI